MPKAVPGKSMAGGYTAQVHLALLGKRGGNLVARGV